LKRKKRTERKKKGGKEKGVKRKRKKRKIRKPTRKWKGKLFSSFRTLQKTSSIEHQRENGGNQDKNKNKNKNKNKIIWGRTTRACQCKQRYQESIFLRYNESMLSARDKKVGWEPSLGEMKERTF